MPDQNVHIQRLRGSTASVDGYTGLEGELVLNMDSRSVRVHDGQEQGGFGTVNAAHMDALPVDGVAPKDLTEGALVVVGSGPLEGGGAGEQYTAYSTSEEESGELKELMPDGGIIIERVPDAKPVMKQIVEGQLVATELSGGIQATYTENEDETESIIDEVEEGALIVEGQGPLNIAASVELDPNGGLTETDSGLAMESPIEIKEVAGEIIDYIPKATTGQYGLVKVSENGGLVQNENGLAVKKIEMTEETVTDKTLKGKPVYRLTIMGTSGGTAKQEIEFVPFRSLAYLNVDEVVLQYAVWNRPSEAIPLGMGDNSIYYNRGYQCIYEIHSETITNSVPVYFTMEYTKTTD